MIAMEMDDRGARALMAAICLNAGQDYLDLIERGGDKPLLEEPQCPCKDSIKNKTACRQTCAEYANWKNEADRIAKENKPRLEYQKLMKFLKSDWGMELFGLFGMRPDQAMDILKKKHMEGKHDTMLSMS